MSDHSVELLGAYLDGELQGKKLGKFELHLEGCEICQKNLHELQELSSILDQATVPDFSSPERFVAQVSLQLPRKKQKRPAERQISVISWYSIPVILMALWVFMNTVFLMSKMLISANIFGFVNLQSSLLFSGIFNDVNILSFLTNMGLLENTSVQWMANVGNLINLMVKNVVWQVSIAVLYLCWLVIWWIHRKPQGRIRSQHR